MAHGNTGLNTLNGLNAVILAAGVGSRLGALTRDRPKALLPLDGDDGRPSGGGGPSTGHDGTGAREQGRRADAGASDVAGTTFLDHSLQCLAVTPVARVYVIGGHAFDALERHASTRWRPWLESGRLILRRFPDYRTVNNAGTVYFAREAFRRPCLLLNSDIVYHPEVLQRAVAHVAAAPDQSFLVVDGSVDLAEEEMKVALDEAGFVRAVSKGLDPRASAGEYIGILYLTPADAARVMGLTAQVLAAGTTHFYYEDAIHRCLDSIRLRPLFIDGLPWIEVDTPDDYRRARALYAAIRRATANRGAGPKADAGPEAVLGPAGEGGVGREREMGTGGSPQRDGGPGHGNAGAGEPVSRNGTAGPGDAGEGRGPGGAAGAPD